jgi:hypothetical protein
MSELERRGDHEDVAVHPVLRLEVVDPLADEGDVLC